MSGYQWLVALGARPDVLIACALIGAITVLAALLIRISDVAHTRRQRAFTPRPAREAAGGTTTPGAAIPYPPVPASLRRNQDEPTRPPAAAQHGALHTVGDIGSASLHAEHALCEARSDLHRAMQRCTEAEIQACRRRFKIKLLAYMDTCCAEYGMTFNPGQIQ